MFFSFKPAFPVLPTLFITLLFGSSALAAPPSSQLIQNVTLTSIAQYTQAGAHIIEVYFEPSTPVNTGCAPTDQLKMVNYWVTTDIATIYATRVAHWMAALATGSQVDLILDGSTCNTSAAYPNIDGPNGLGLKLMSMRVYAD